MDARELVGDDAFGANVHLAMLRGRSADGIFPAHGSAELAEVILVRAVMAAAAKGAGVEPRDLSFAGTMQAANAFAPVLWLADPADLPRLHQVLLRAIARRRVGHRPDRYEPRAVKRRAKPIALLAVPRAQARKQLAMGVASKH